MFKTLHKIESKKIRGSCVKVQLPKVTRRRVPAILTHLQIESGQLLQFVEKQLNVVPPSSSFLSYSYSSDLVLS